MTTRDTGPLHRLQQETGPALVSLAKHAATDSQQKGNVENVQLTAPTPFMLTNFFFKKQDSVTDRDTYACAHSYTYGSSYEVHTNT